MKKFLLEILRAPKTAELFNLYTFKSAASARDSDTDIIDGILLGRESKKAYPIVDRIPVMLNDAFTENFLKTYAGRIAGDEALSKLDLRSQCTSDWSFSDEWDQHFQAELVRTWGWSVEQRVSQFLLEVNVDREWCRGKLILDAGCGNGQLSEGLSRLGANVVGIDYSTSVSQAERNRTSSTLHFVRGDLQSPPFEEGTFDLIVSNGVLHHTPNTSKTFAAVAKLVRPGGHFYLWLYRKPERFGRRYLFYPALDLARLVISRIPRGPQRFVVKFYALGLMTLHKQLKKRRDLSWSERVVGAYDTLTPRWRHYHTPFEVSYWFFSNGYSAATLTHWDNPYGFGMVATKARQSGTPGVNFQKPGMAKRHWE